MEGISNTEIVNFFAEKTSDDLKQNFVGVVPSNYVVKFINFPSVMLKTGSTFYLIVLVLKDLESSSSRMIKTQSVKYFMALKSLIKRMMR